MADGRTHDILTKHISVGLPILVGGWYAWIYDGRFLLMALLSWLGCQLQRVTSPDLDVNAGFYGFGIIRRNLGYVVGISWEIIWKPYSLLVAHRSWISHGVIVGSLIRLGYIYLVYFLITRIYPPAFIVINKDNFEYFFVFFIGFLVADVGHLALDKFKIWR